MQNFSLERKKKKKERTRVIQLTTYCMFAQIEKLSKLKILRGGELEEKRRRKREGKREREREGDRERN